MRARAVGASRHSPLLVVVFIPPVAEHCKKGDIRHRCRITLSGQGRSLNPRHLSSKKQHNLVKDLNHGN